MKRFWFFFGFCCCCCCCCFVLCLCFVVLFYFGFVFRKEKEQERRRQKSTNEGWSPSVSRTWKVLGSVLSTAQPGHSSHLEAQNSGAEAGRSEVQGHSGLHSGASPGYLRLSQKLKARPTVKKKASQGERRVNRNCRRVDAPTKGTKGRDG